jgi:hypothetical protein
MDFEALERLGRLRSTGAISEEEFESEKRRLLNRQTSHDDEDSERLAKIGSATVSDEEHSVRNIPRTILIVIVVLAVLTGAGFAAYRYLLTQKSASNASEPGASVQYLLRSQVRGVHIAPTTELPQNPHGTDSSCEPYEKVPGSDAAKSVKAKGWHVTAEHEISGLQAVSFAGACAPVNENAFTPIDANVGMYDGEQLRAVIYGKALGYVEDGGDPAQLRIASKSNEQIGRIIVASHKISIQR